MRRPPHDLVIAGVVGALSALVPSVLMWGFTVDDALISIRYAHHVATGVGFRFDAAGPPTDGVTPLPWPLLLAPFARGAALSTLAAAKVIGAAAWTAAGALLGVRAARVGGLASASAALFVLALAYPVGAWAASGMETGLATALATAAAVSLERPRRAALLAGLAASLRPELAPWAVALAVLSASARAERSALPRALAAPAALAIAPFAACAAIRLATFGRPAPLAILAKPSDLAHGLAYAGAATLAVLTPLFASLRPGARAVTLAFAVHVLVVVAVGGDWMPYARLLVPVAPSLVLAFADGGRARSRAALAARVLPAAALGVLLVAKAAPAGRHVQADREDLIARARPALADARVGAALDGEWVSAATTARIVDLAGLTDPTIAVLAGGHTSKRVDAGMLLDRGVDVVVVYSPPRIVEARLTSSELFERRFEKRESLRLGARGASYDVYRRRSAD